MWFNILVTFALSVWLRLPQILPQTLIMSLSMLEPIYMEGVKCSQSIEPIFMEDVIYTLEFQCLCLKLYCALS